MKRYELRLTLDDTYVILEESEHKLLIDALFDWFVNHKKFFNGEFSIEEVGK